MRQNSVGEKVIRGMYNQFLKPKPKMVEYDPTLTKAIICDLDGTLALFGDANPYDRDFSKDIVNEAVFNILYYIPANAIILVSGRTEKYREQTEEWLRANQVGYGVLYMRKEGDNRKDVIVKSEIYEEHIKGKYNIDYVLDDRNQVVDFWRSEGLTCLQVNYGDF